jgi:glutamate N-acetyltransferase/amino-acid N-acetyltransferase
MKKIDGAITAPKGFKAAGVRCGIKQHGKDVTLVYSDAPAVSAALFTTNKIKAAPVLVSIEHAKAGKAQAIVANAGNANCCTGNQGLADAKEMTELAAKALGLSPEEVLVCSTGIIGHYLPMDLVRVGIADAASALSPEGGPGAAEAIMTTDTKPKAVACEIEIGGVPVRIGGIAKGVGMIEPNVATMFCFVTTDAAISRDLLQESLALAAEVSFNSLTVDGDTSTNDTVIALANGLAENPVIDTEGPELETFQEALDLVCEELTRMMARDGEGATKLVEVVVKNAPSYPDAKKMAKTIANSPLVKTATFGKDPNWGRVMAAAGRSGAPLDPTTVDLYFGDVKIIENGAPQGVDPEVARKPMLADELAITVDLKMGEAESRVFTCDFSYEYVKINAEYHT